MHRHPKARLTQKGRPRRVTQAQHPEHGRSLAELAAESGTSLCCACRCLARDRSGAHTSLADRWSVRCTQRRGDLIHSVVKSLARFRKVGHRIIGVRQQGRSTGVGYNKLHVAVDDATRLAYVEARADEGKPTVIAFLSPPVSPRLWRYGIRLPEPPATPGSPGCDPVCYPRDPIQGKDPGGIWGFSDSSRTAAALPRPGP